MEVPRDDRIELLLALSVALHHAGLPTDSLEETIRELGVVLGVPAQPNALPTTYTLAVGSGFTQQIVVLRLDPGTVDLQKLALLDRVIRDLRQGASPKDALEEVRAIDALVPANPPLMTVLAYAILSCGAAFLLGGGRGEIIVSSIVGVAIGIIAAIALRSRRVDRVFEISAAFVATVIVALWERFATPISLYVAVIAGIVQLLPGYSLTTALSELANRNWVAGTSRLGGVLVTLLSLIAGFVLGAGVGGNALLTAPTVSPGIVTWWSTLLAPLLMGLAIASILHARLRDVGWIVVSCVATVALARFLPALGITQATPFATAFAIGLATNLAARFLRIPPAVVLVPGLLVLVPGSLSYQSLLELYQADPTDAISLAVHALLAAILIVAGFLTSQLVAPTRRLT